MMAVMKAETKFNFQDVGYLGFETLTYVPIDHKLIDASILTPKEREWLNDYHKICWDKLSPFLQNDAETLQWLKRYTNVI